MPYIAMEYLAGQSLEAMLTSGAGLSHERVLSIAIGVARALETAHAAGIIHRDIRPNNIFITTAGQAKVIDFERAYVEDSERTSTGTVLGSPIYRSLKQVMGKKLDGRRDLFSLGVVLYQMLIGEKLASGTTYHAIARRILRKDPTLLSHLDASIAPAHYAVIVRLLTKNPARRYRSATDLIQDLETLLRGTDVPGSTS